MTTRIWMALIAGACFAFCLLAGCEDRPDTAGEVIEERTDRLEDRADEIEDMGDEMEDELE